ncbi:DUF6286 domain-containing protein [Streptomyces sp. BI20]|uniref:DUF6286 domain-containing protein n=1 Tax=Streptomyces sp. BI20 TaxID=3403460 RepID=UPI003C7525E8
MSGPPVSLAKDSGAGAAPEVAPPAAIRPRRFRAGRRLPAVLVALGLGGAAGLLLYDVLADRAGRGHWRLRGRAADLLAEHTPADPAVLGSAVVLALLGLALLWFALTPGRRGLVPLAAPPGVRVGIGRRDAGRLLRDRVLEVPGVRGARVRVRGAGRVRIGVRASSHFRDLDEVRADVVEALDAGIAELAPARAPRRRVRVVRPTEKG